MVDGSSYFILLGSRSLTADAKRSIWHSGSRDLCRKLGNAALCPVPQSGSDMDGTQTCIPLPGM